MVRATRRSTHPYQHVPDHGRRGVAGYRGVAADALEDPEPTYPRPVENEEPGVGAGGVTVDNQSDPPFPASTFIAPSATESAPDEATLGNPNVIQGDADEGGDGATVQAGSATTNNGGNLDLSGGSGLSGKGGGNVVIGGGSGDGGLDQGALVTIEGGVGGGDGRIELAGAEIAFTTPVMGFFSTGAVARPVVPLTTPNVQDVIDALVTLGLVTQSD